LKKPLFFLTYFFSVFSFQTTRQNSLFALFLSKQSLFSAVLPLPKKSSDFSGALFSFELSFEVKHHLMLEK